MKRYDKMGLKKIAWGLYENSIPTVKSVKWHNKTISICQKILFIRGS